MASEFKQFLLRGNVADLAVAVVIGAAFGAVITSLVENLLTPLIGAIFGEPDFAALDFTINGSLFGYGLFINAVLAFVMIAAAVFFVVVRPLNRLMARSKNEPPADPTSKKCTQCLSEIPLEAVRCAFCTSEQALAA
jgi:large conductance mechanosensitive channel